MGLFGLIDLSVAGYVLLTLALTHITIISVTVFLHRHQAHRALKLHPLLSHFFRFWLWLTTGIITRDWVAIHRKHHAKCETKSDPHSPQVKGLREVFWRGAELYRKEADNRETIAAYGRGTPDDWLERNVYDRFSFMGIVLLLILHLTLFGPVGLTIWAIQMIWIPLWAAGVINGVGHYWGYRNYEIPNASTNIIPWGIFIGGEELHNNHHAFSSSAKLSNRWWEFDLGWFYIRLFCLLGLAQVRKVAPKRRLIAERDQLDLDAAKSLTINRLQLLTEYSQHVLHPVFRDEISKAKRSLRQLYRRARRLARRDTRLLTELDKAWLAEALENSYQLHTVYQYKLRLLDVWNQQAKSYDARLESLRQWCAQAEASGIKVLADFAQLMRRYEVCA